MVKGSSSSCRRLVVFVVAVMTVAASLAAEAGDVRKRPKKHFLSWESVNAHDKMRPWRRVTRPEREFDVRRRKVVRLKKPSLFNRKPVQFSTPVIKDELLFVGNNTGWFYAVDIQQNKKVWSKILEGGVESTAVADGNNVYVGDIKGYAYSLDASRGDLNWKVSLGSEMLGEPLIVGSIIYFVTLDGRLFALSKATGAELWHTDAMERTVGFTVRRQSAPIYYNGMIIYGTSRGTLVAYHHGGSIAWVRMLGNPSAQVMDVDSKALIVGNRLYAASADGELFCLNPRDGNIMWSIGAGGANDLLYHDGLLYATGRGTLAAVNLTSGNVLWEQNLETAEISSPAGGKGYVAVVSTNAKLFLIDQKNGDVVFERYIRKGSYGDPIILGDELYVLANTSRLFSFEIHEKQKKQKKQKKQEGQEGAQEG